MKTRIQKPEADTGIVDIYFKKFLAFHKKTDNYRLNNKLSAVKKKQLLKEYFYGYHNLCEMKKQGLI